MTERIDADDNSKPGSLEIKREDTVEPVSMYCATTLRMTLWARSDKDVSDEVDCLGSNWLIASIYEPVKARSTPRLRTAVALLWYGRLP